MGWASHSSFPAQPWGWLDWRRQGLEEAGPSVLPLLGKEGVKALPHCHAVRTRWHRVQMSSWLCGNPCRGCRHPDIAPSTLHPNSLLCGARLLLGVPEGSQAPEPQSCVARSTFPQDPWRLGVTPFASQVPVVFLIPSVCAADTIVVCVTHTPVCTHTAVHTCSHVCAHVLLLLAVVVTVHPLHSSIGLCVPGCSCSHVLPRCPGLGRCLLQLGPLLLSLRGCITKGA